jgi:hypothetical protein
MIVPLIRDAQAGGSEKALQNRIFARFPAISRQSLDVTGWKMKSRRIHARIHPWPCQPRRTTL